MVDNSRALLDAYEDGTLDAVIVRSDDDRRDGEVLGPEHFGWFASSDFEHHTGEPLRIASHPSCCTVREVATRLLDAASIRWTEVFVGGTSAVTAALSAGLAVAAFPCRLATADMIEVSQMLNLPSIPSLSIVLHSSLTDPKTRETLRAITAAFSEHRRNSNKQISLVPSEWPDGKRPDKERPANDNRPTDGDAGNETDVAARLAVVLSIPA
ncbi:LysR substrate-binding domain-containing protein [Sinorhizobium meliloti]|uniref:Transcriptional regulator n=3 Tax=Rhizobium meliloti TaxID=382 RepID=Q92K83_RHIME|nr:LysR substrate-binding domain-containing protein [Sinorhizobium meliloti]PST25850.1 LysR family transcriptional regulator [Mesorhizobium loti]AEG53531.1 LysR substrate-binding protein [Sinorhizobium meliloti AK83]AEH78780.1 putative transcriptional regulator [Sinorhizobium meliloti SM11]AGG74479.1 Putative transcriptional regulator [Sinorhizobium meliloti 2011]AIL99761.1 LysR family transcriptional regulator [Sinorhizobium meliloti]